MTLALTGIAGIVIGATSLFMSALMFSLARTVQNMVWGFFCLAVFCWGFMFYFIASTQDASVALLWWKISHIGVILIPVLFMQFVYAFTRKMNPWLLISTYALGLFFLYTDLFTSSLISVKMSPWGFYFNHGGIFYPALVAFFFIFITYGHYLLLRAYLASSDPAQRRQIQYFFIATVVGFVGGSVSFAPVFEWYLSPTAILTVPLYPIIMGYAILKYRLFNLRVVAAQLMALLLFVVSFAKLFTATTVSDYLINGGLIVVVLVLGGYLIRSVMYELEQRDLIERQEKELEVANAQQESLLHFMSHEIKGYLTKSEAGFAAISQGDFGPVSPALATMSENAVADVRKGVRTVMDILDASNLKRGTVSYKKVSFDLKDTVRSVVEHLRPAIDEKHLTVETSFAWEVPCTVNGDEEKIRSHVVRNLVDNAIKYTPAGTIKVEVIRAGPVVRFSIKDSGVGITDEDKKKLFTEGGHGKDSVKINVHSTGYGLYIAKTIVEAQGGKIWAESEGAGKGSRFVFELAAA